MSGSRPKHKLWQEENEGAENYVCKLKLIRAISSVG